MLYVLLSNLANMKHSDLEPRPLIPCHNKAMYSARMGKIQHSQRFKFASFSMIHYECRDKNTAHRKLNKQTYIKRSHRI